MFFPHFPPFLFAYWNADQIHVDGKINSIKYTDNDAQQKNFPLNIAKILAATIYSAATYLFFVAFFASILLWTRSVAKRNTIFLHQRWKKKKQRGEKQFEKKIASHQHIIIMMMYKCWKLLRANKKKCLLCGS